MGRFECHAHTFYSNLRGLDALQSPRALVERACEIGLTGICITDHESLSCHPELDIIQEDIKKVNPNFKIGRGDEIYLVDSLDKGQQYYHFILIAKDKIGHKTLREISSTAWLHSYFDRGIERVPTLKTDLQQIILKYGKGHLIASSACLGSEIDKQILRLHTAEQEHDIELAKQITKEIAEFINFCKNLFPNDFYLEVQPAQSEEQLIVNRRMKSLAKYFNLKIIITTDAHYLKEEDRAIHKAFLNSKNIEREVDSFYHYAFLQTTEQVIKNLESTDLDYYELEKNTNEIYDKIEEYSLFKKQQIPQVEVFNYPKEESNHHFYDVKKYPTLDYLAHSDNPQERYWVNYCQNELEKKHLNNEKYLSRLEEEADTKKVIGEKLDTCMFSYPIFLQHYIDLFWECGSCVGAGRGSAGSGLNHYLLGITQTDPIRTNAPWFRYMNKERVEIGDIDIDLDPTKRELIFSKIREERGPLGCVQVCTFGTASSKSAIQIACLAPNTLINTKNGLKAIQNITSLDYVYDVYGLTPVVSPTKRTYNGILYSFNCSGIGLDFDVTHNHQLLVYTHRKKQSYGSICNYNRCQLIDPLGNVLGEFLSVRDAAKYYTRYTGNSFSSMIRYKKSHGYKIVELPTIKNNAVQWLCADQIKKTDYLLTPIFDTQQNEDNFLYFSSAEQNPFKKHCALIPEKIEITVELGELIGIYLAEGHIGYNCHGITLTINQNETWLKNRIIYLVHKCFNIPKNNITLHSKKESLGLDIQVNSTPLGRWFNKFCPGNSLTKQIPYFIMNSTLSVKKACLYGHFYGDGYGRIRNNSYESKSTSISYQLIQDLWQIAAQNGYNCSVITEKRKFDKSRHVTYNLMFYGKTAQSLYESKYLHKINYDWETEKPLIYNNIKYYKIKINDISHKEYNGYVYCLETKSHNYLLNNIVSHNCRGMGIDVDVAKYISSMVPSERGFIWPLHDVVYGNEEKGRKPNAAFLAEVKKYPRLLETAMGIEGVVTNRSLHASGVNFYGKDPYDTACFMKATNGSVSTQYSLEWCEHCGDTKLDFLVTQQMTIMGQCIQMLQEHGYFEKDLTLRQAYDKYVHPDKLPLDDSKLWDAIDSTDILALFQLNTAVGGNVVRQLVPRTVEELVACNALMRLSGEAGKERPADRYERLKKHPEQWQKEMDDWGFSEEEQRVLRKYMGADYGAPSSQEVLMLILMDKDTCNFTLAESNQARKIISKKKIKEIPSLKQKILSQAKNKHMGEYIWEYVIMPQASYSFSRIHGYSYSLIACQAAFLATYYPSVYWNTAYLRAISGLEEDSTSNYGKIAKGVCDIIKHGCEVSLVDINKSQYFFEPDEEHNRIIYGMKALNGVGGEVIQEIIENRPYKSLEDFEEKTKVNKIVMVSLIKSGAFDSFGKREDIMRKYLHTTTNPKKKLTLQNFNALIENNLIPKELIFQKRVFNFNKGLKKDCKFNSEYFALHDVYYKFFIKFFDEDMIEPIDNQLCLNKKAWKKEYDKVMSTAKSYIIENQQELLNKLNGKMDQDAWNKYAAGSISHWEMESLGMYYHEHELSHVKMNMYDIVSFNDLPQNPVVDYTFKRGDTEIPIYKTDRIAGTVIAKDDMHSSISLLTIDKDVITVKFSRDYFARYNRIISEVQNGTKKRMENSWFQRGTLVVCNGIRRGNSFFTKSYKKTKSHQLYKITQINSDGTIEMTNRRYGEE